MRIWEEKRGGYVEDGRERLLVTEGRKYGERKSV